MKDLRDTIDLMTSEDYKDRFRAEYWQAKIRYDKLDAMTVRYEAGTINFTPNCSLELLKEQKRHMGNYIRCLKIRAEIEGVDLNRNPDDLDVAKAMKWLEDYAFVDKKEVYTNGTMLVPLFRVEQAFMDMAYNGFLEG